jgi:uncharacterized protein YlxW (UPF0749 family)
MSEHQDDNLPEQQPEQQPTGRARLVAALKRPGSRGQLVAALLLAVLGFAAVVQVQAQGSNDKYVGARQQDLIALINQLSLASQRADGEISRLVQTRNSLRNDTDSRRTALERARQQANTLGILAGTLPAVGPGVRVTVKDPTGNVGTDQLLNGIEELRDAGAEAIEINGIRVVAQSSVQDSPNGGVVVDNQQIAPPYTILAIGDPHTLATALNFTGGFIYGVGQVDGSVAVEQLDSVEIDSTVKQSAPQYAAPTPNQ